MVHGGIADHDKCAYETCHCCELFVLKVDEVVIGGSQGRGQGSIGH